MNKIRVRHGDNEIELEGSDAFIKKHLDGFYSRIQAQKSEKIEPFSKRKIFTKDFSDRKKGEIPNPAEYYKAKGIEKGKTDGVSQILIFSKYLEEFRNVSEFSRKDINDVAEEARLSKDIHGQYFTNAVKQGLLRSIGGGKYSLTLSAEEILSTV